MKKYLPHIIAFAVGALIASLVFLLIRANEKKIDQNGELVKTETITKVDTIIVTKEKIKTEIVEKEGKTEYVYIQLPPEVIEKIVHDTTYIYNDIPLHKEYFHSRTDEVEIWHSGIQSSIDSLINYRETKVINNVYRKDKKNSISFGVDVNYSGCFHVPLQLEYTRDVTPWFSVGVYGEYEPVLRQFGGGATAKVNISW